MERSIVRVVVVDDFEPWRRQICSTLLERPEFQIIAEVSDGQDAVRKAQELQPDLILLDIGLPKLNGIEAARQIRKCAPHSKILFVSENRSWEIAEEGLRTGATGYVVKSDAAGELIPAVTAVLQGQQFVSARFADHDLAVPMNDDPAHSLPGSVATVLPPENAEISHHEVTFYPDDASLIDGFARFIEAALKAGHAVITIVTESHRVSLLQRLRADGIDLDNAFDHGRFILADVADTLSKVMVIDQPDKVRCAQLVGDLVARAPKSASGNRVRVVACGECAPTLLAESKAEAAIQLEHLWDEVTTVYQVDTLCGYSRSVFPPLQSSSIFERICGEHSAVHALPSED